MAVKLAGRIIFIMLFLMALSFFSGRVGLPDAGAQAPGCEEAPNCEAETADSKTNDQPSLSEAPEPVAPAPVLVLGESAAAADSGK